MARTAITITQVNRTGVAQPSVQNADNVNGMSLENPDSKTVLEVSATTGTVNFDFVFRNSVDGVTVPDKTVAATTTPKMVGPFPTELYNQADGTVLVDIDSANGRLRAYRL